MAGTSRGERTQARTRSSEADRCSLEREGWRLRRLTASAPPRRAGLYMVITAGVVMKVVKSAIRTSMANVSSLRTCSLERIFF